MSEKKIEFTDTIKAMTEYPTSNVVEDTELAEALQLTADIHVASNPDADRNGHYGSCQGCGEPWPCSAWGQASYASVGWLIDASNAIMRRSGSLSPALPIGDNPPRLEVELPECMLCRGKCRGFSDTPEYLVEVPEDGWLDAQINAILNEVR